MNIKDTYSFTIASHYAPAIINGDCSGLDEYEDVHLDNFLSWVEGEHGAGIWEVVHAEPEFAKDDISDQMADCILFFYHVEA